MTHSGSQGAVDAHFNKWQSRWFQPARKHPHEVFLLQGREGGNCGFRGRADLAQGYRGLPPHPPVLVSQSVDDSGDGINRSDAVLPRFNASARLETVVPNGNAAMCRPSKGKGASGYHREAESTDAPERGGLPRSVRLAAHVSGGLKSHSARGHGSISKGGGNSSPARGWRKVWRGY